MGESEISQFHTHPAGNRNVAASTQNQAPNALVFLYRNVLKIELGDFGHIERAKKPKNLPEVTPNHLGFNPGPVASTSNIVL